MKLQSVKWTSVMKRAFITGIDGLSPAVLEPALESGYMPFLAEMRASGASGILASTIPAITPAAWGTFQTGRSPAANNTLDFVSFDKTTRRLIPASSRTLQKTIWQYASDAGMRVCVVNVPMTYPTYPVNGCIVSGILTPNEESDFTWPHELKDEILAAMPEYKILNLENISALQSAGDYQAVVEALADIVRMRARLGRMLLGRDACEVFMLHFQANDVLQHLLWPWMDEKSPRFNKERRKYIFEHFHSVMDEEIRSLYELFKGDAAEDEITFLAASDHGFEMHKCAFNLGFWLKERGFIKLASRKVSWKKRISRFLKVGRILKSFMKEESVNRLEVKAGVRAASPVDYDNSLCFTIGKTGEGYLYLLKDECEETDALLNALKTIKYHVTGENILKKIVRPADIYSCPIPVNFPDYILLPADGFSFNGSLHEKVLFAEPEPGIDFHLGKHHADGFYIAAGAGIGPAAQDRNIIDITPMLLERLGIDLPAGLESEADISIKDTDEDTSEEMRRRLTDLGYM
jgi:predicted AlkP superfamily phosphohydrolase/phosphomutase